MSKRYYTTAKLSERISETPEGFLVCHDVPITKAGALVYQPGEVPISNGDGMTTITRTVEDIHDPLTIASFEGKPVTINHPDEFVTPDNWRELSVGIVQNVRPGEGEHADKLLADLLITDREAINAVRSKKLREVSCGYEAEYIESAPGLGRQEGILGNHVALVAAGRCGSECAIFDHAPKQETIKMSLKQKLIGVFGKALDEAMPEEDPAKQEDAGSADMAAMMDALMKRMDAVEAAMKPAAMKPAAKEGCPPAADEVDPASPAPSAADPIEKRLSVIEAALAKLLGMEEQEAAMAGDMCKDTETVSRAEILAPGISKTADVKIKSLDAAYATEDGKKVIDTLLAGKDYEKADKDMLFVAASELMKGARREQFINKVSLDSLPGMKAGDMTPEKINQMNAARYGTK